MIQVIFCFATFIIITPVICETPSEIRFVTNYEYYENFNIRSGLNADLNAFFLNGKQIFIYSASLHYFRVPSEYWRDRLRKIRAAGFNAVATVVPWNLHEPQKGIYDFGYNGNDMSRFLDLSYFLYCAKLEDLFVIIRVGPYISSDFEFGGLPRWLLAEENIQIRTSDPGFMNHVRDYFNVLIPYLLPSQWTWAGSIIMFQMEQDYSISGKNDVAYLRELRQLMLDLGVAELMVTADPPDKVTSGAPVNQLLMTGNFDINADPKTQLDMMGETQLARPKMVMQYLSGQCDFWASQHYSEDLQIYTNNLETILKYPASVNIYMFVGGSNYGFYNGAVDLTYDGQNSDYHSCVSSYDFSALIDEVGNYTKKYYVTKELLDKYNPIRTKLPIPPDPPQVTIYPSITIEQQIDLSGLLESITPISSLNVIPMEKLDINSNSGQGYGYVVYRKLNLDIPTKAELEIEGRVFDTFMVLVNGILVSPWLQSVNDINNTVTSHTKDPKISLTDTALTGAILDIVVENWGRVSKGNYIQFKGLWQGSVKINGNNLTDWLIYPLEFKSPWTNGLNNWVDINDSKGPTLYRADFHLIGSVPDTFIHMEKWIKGIVIVNGFVLGRYAKMGPIQTLYLPGGLLQRGNNTILIFEHYQADTEIQFANSHIYKNY